VEKVDVAFFLKQNIYEISRRRPM